MKIIIILAGISTLVLSTTAVAKPRVKIVWKTLKNSNGFSIQYPPNWGIAAVGEDPPTKEFQVVVGGPKGATKRWVRIQLGAGSSAGGTTPHEMAYRDLMGSNVKTPISQRTLIVGGEPAYEGTYLNPARRGSGMVWKYIAVRHDGKPFFFQIEEDGPDARSDTSDKSWKYKKEIDRVINSFRFTN